VPAYVVFTDATLEVLAEKKPADQQEMLAIPGIGAKKVDHYGVAVLAVLRGESPAITVISRPVVLPQEDAEASV
jgi:DNA helicase-2/ATP-dependent DNA helicase PcrA